MPLQGEGQPRPGGRMRKLTLAGLTAATAGFSTGTAQAADAQLSGEAARGALAATGHLDDVQIEGALDLAGLTTPDGGPLILYKVDLRGALRGAPAAALQIWDSVLGGLRAPHTEWRSPVDIESSEITGHVNLDGARFEKGFACRRCTFSSLSAFRARFDDDADFSFSDFKGLVNFGAARFHSAAFDGARFEEADGPNFSETDFAGEARFARVSTAEAPVNFLGASFRGEANFRRCDFGRGVFSRLNAPDKRAGPIDTEIASFGQLADFRSCEFRRGADFAAAAFQAGARFDGATIPEGVLDLRGLTRVEGEIVLRDIKTGPRATLALDEESIAHLQLDSAGLDPARWRGLSPDVLDSIADRAKALGFESSARRLHYVANTQRAWGAGATLADRAKWASQWPSANGTDLVRPLVLGGVLWLCAALLTLKRGVLVEVAASGEEKANVFARVTEPIYLPAEEAALQAGRLPKSAFERAAAAAAFGFALVFKLGARRFRPAYPGRWRTRGLFVIWLAGFAAVAVIVVTTGQMLPGLREMMSALP